MRRNDGRGNHLGNLGHARYAIPSLQLLPHEIAALNSAPRAPPPTPYNAPLTPALTSSATPHASVVAAMGNTHGQHGGGYYTPAVSSRSAVAAERRRPPQPPQRTQAPASSAKATVNGLGPARPARCASTATISALATSSGGEGQAAEVAAVRAAFERARAENGKLLTEAQEAASEVHRLQTMAAAARRRREHAGGGGAVAHSQYFAPQVEVAELRARLHAAEQEISRLCKPGDSAVALSEPAGVGGREGHPSTMEAAEVAATRVALGEAQMANNVLRQRLASTSKEAAAAAADFSTLQQRCENQEQQLREQAQQLSQQQLSQPARPLAPQPPVPATGGRSRSEAQARARARVLSRSLEAARASLLEAVRATREASRGTAAAQGAAQRSLERLHRAIADALPPPLAKPAIEVAQPPLEEVCQAAATAAAGVKSALSAVLTALSSLPAAEGGKEAVLQGEHDRTVQARPARGAGLRIDSKSPLSYAPPEPVCAMPSQHHEHGSYDVLPAVTSPLSASMMATSLSPKMKQDFQWMEERRRQDALVAKQAAAERAAARTAAAERQASDGGEAVTLTKTIQFEREALETARRNKKRHARAKMRAAGRASWFMSALRTGGASQNDGISPRPAAVLEDSDVEEEEGEEEEEEEEKEQEVSPEMAAQIAAGHAASGRQKLHRASAAMGAASFMKRMSAATTAAAAEAAATQAAAEAAVAEQGGRHKKRTMSQVHAGLQNLMPMDAADFRKRNSMDLVNFLKAIPLFHTLQQQQLNHLAQSCLSGHYTPGTVIIRQGDVGHTFYVVETGVVNVFLRDALQADEEAGAVRPPAADEGEGRLVNIIGHGEWFGERALMHEGPRAATVIAEGDVRCLVLQKDAFQSVLSSVRELVGAQYLFDALDDGARAQAFALRAHIDDFCKLQSMYAPAMEAARSAAAEAVANDDAAGAARHNARLARQSRRRQLLLELLTVFSPELTLDDVIERMVRVTRDLFNVEEVALFTVDWNDDGSGENRSGTSDTCEPSMFLKVSRDARGVVLPLKGIAGDVALRNNDRATGSGGASVVTVCTPNAASHPLFDPAVDGFRFDNEEDDDEGGAAAGDAAVSEPSADEIAKAKAEVRELLAVPICEPGGLRVIGVLELRNRASAIGSIAAAAPVHDDDDDEDDDGVGAFTRTDERLLLTAAGQFATALQQRSAEIPLTADSARFTPAHTVRDVPLRVKVVRARLPVFGAGSVNKDEERGINPDIRPGCLLSVTVQLYHGGTQIAPPLRTARCKSYRGFHAASRVGADGRRADLGGERNQSASVSMGCGPSATAEFNLDDAEVAGDMAIAELQTTWLPFEIDIANLPHGARAIFSVWHGSGRPAGWAACHLFDFDNVLKGGALCLRLFENQPCLTPHATTLQRRRVARYEGAVKDDVDNGAVLEVVFASGEPGEAGGLPAPSKPVVWVDSRHAEEVEDAEIEAAAARFGGGGPIVFPGTEGEDQGNPEATGRAVRRGSVGPAGWRGPHWMRPRLARSRAELAPWAQRRVDAVVRDPKLHLTPADRELLWWNRMALTSIPAALPKMLLSVDWADRRRVNEVYRLIHLWEPLNPVEALQLLDHKFPDPKVRAHAVQSIEQLPDAELRKYLLQLTQVLKYEHWHDSALARFLLRRALRSPQTIGHLLFWFLKVWCSARFALPAHLVPAALTHCCLPLRRLRCTTGTYRSGTV
jgi:CRP-like cAMP-binding protein